MVRRNASSTSTITASHDTDAEDNISVPDALPLVRTRGKPFPLESSPTNASMAHVFCGVPN